MNGSLIRTCLAVSRVLAAAVLGFAAQAVLAADMPNSILRYAESKTFVGYPILANAQLAVADGQGAISKKGVNGESIEKQSKRFDAEELADMHAEIGSAYSAMGAHYLALLEYTTAHALTGVRGKYASDVAAELDSLEKDDDAAKYYEEMLRQRPDDYFGRREYGFFLLSRGRYAKSRDLLLSFLKVPDLGDRDRAYALIYLYLAAKGAGGDPRATLRPYLSNVSQGDWPAPLARFFAGQETEAALIRDLQRGDEQGNLCEALFYMGRDVELGRDSQTALAYYREVLRTNYIGFREYGAAQYRLKVLLAPHRGKS